MGKWSVYDVLSGSDGALRLALQLCNAAGNDFTDWPEDVQNYSQLKPNSTASVNCLSAVTDAGPKLLICQALPSTYARCVEIIDSMTAEMWNDPVSFYECLQFLNTPDDISQSHDSPVKYVWDVGGQGDERTCSGYEVYGLLLMRAGAAMPAGFRDAILNGLIARRNWVKDNRADLEDSRLFFAERMCEEIQRYDIRGGRIFKLRLELPPEILGGSSYQVLGPNMDSFTEWERMCSRLELPAAQRERLWNAPKLWEKEGVHDIRLSDDEMRDLPILFDAKRKAAVALALNPRAGWNSVLHSQSEDILERVCDYLHGELPLTQTLAEDQISFRPDHKSNWEMLSQYKTTSRSTSAEKQWHSSTAMLLKIEANVAFCKHEYTTAANLYAQALGAIVETPTSDEDVALKLIVHSNLAEACLRIRQWNDAALHAAEALKLDGTHEKSIRRLAAAKQGLASDETINRNFDPS